MSKALDEMFEAISDDEVMSDSGDDDEVDSEQGPPSDVSII